MDQHPGGRNNIMWTFDVQTPGWPPCISPWVNLFDKEIQTTKILMKLIILQHTRITRAVKITNCSWISKMHLCWKNVFSQLVFLSDLARTYRGIWNDVKCVCKMGSNTRFYLNWVENRFRIKDIPNVAISLRIVIAISHQLKPLRSQNCTEKHHLPYWECSSK